MADQRLVRYQPSPVEIARDEVGWLDDDDAALIEGKDVATAVGLSLISGGGGHFYVRDNVTGLGLSIVALASLIAIPSFPLVALLTLVGVLGGSAVLAAAKVRKVNRYVVLRRQHEAALASHPTHKLLDAMTAAGAHPPRNYAPAPPGPASAPPPSEQPAYPPTTHGDLVDKLRKLIHLRDANVITELEHRDRKIDLLAAAASGLGRDQTDELLFELLPLIREGTIADEDVEFVKSLGA